MILLLLTAALVASLVLSMGFGAVSIPAGEVASVVWEGLCALCGSLSGHEAEMPRSSVATILLSIRMPRVLMAAIVGAGLSLSGVVMQAIVRNPLANPYILGISSGATLGAAAAILLGAFTVFGNYGTSLGAFLGALAASAFVFTVAFSGRGSSSTVKLLLSGMAVNAICSSFTSFLVYTANDAEGIRDINFWTMGSLTSTTWEMLPIPLWTVLLLGLFFLTQFRALDVMLLGQDAATTLGVNIVQLRKIYMALSACITGVMVAVVGTIGFVGLIVPHVTRMFTGAEHRRLIPASLLLGSIFLVWCDVFARIYLQNVELPIGIVTGIIGGPFFIYLMLTKQYGFGGE